VFLILCLLLLNAQDLTFLFRATGHSGFKTPTCFPRTKYIRRESSSGLARFRISLKLALLFDLLCTITVCGLETGERCVVSLQTRDVRHERPRVSLNGLP
jgi:hypothetical protein